MISRQCSVVSFSVDTGKPFPPANAATMSTGPSWLATVAVMRATSSGLVQSAATQIAIPPRAAIAVATESRAPSSRPTAATATPLAASAAAVAAPIPREPPVMIATLPTRSGYVAYSASAVAVSCWALAMSDPFRRPRVRAASRPETRRMKVRCQIIRHRSICSRVNALPPDRNARRDLTAISMYSCHMSIDKGVSAEVTAPAASGGDGGSDLGENKRRPASRVVFRLDTGSGVPTYLQLVQQVEHALRLGYLTPGDQLPKVRDVVAELAINPNPVLKAYRELEIKGLATGRPGQGTFVQAALTQVALPELGGLRKSLLSWLTDADAAGLDEDGVVALFTSVLRDFYKSRGGGADRGVASGGKEGVA